MRDTLRVERPCARRWSDLVGDDVRRFCGDCDKHVFNLDAMLSAEIDALRQTGGFCATYVGDERGAFTVPRPTSPAPRRAATAVAVAVLASVIGGCAGRQTSDDVASPEPSVAAKTAQTPPSTIQLDETTKERLRQLGYVR